MGVLAFVAVPTSSTEAMQTRRHAQRLAKTLCHTTMLLNVSPNRLHGLSCRGGMSAAQHNAPRQGSALPTTGVSSHVDAMLTPFQRHGNARLKKNAMPNAIANDAMPNAIANVFFYRVDAHPLTPSLRGEVDLWETLPLNNTPFLLAPLNAVFQKSSFY